MGWTWDLSCSIIFAVELGPWVFIFCSQDTVEVVTQICTTKSSLPIQSLGLDVRVLRDDNTEVEIMETIDYGDTDYRYEMEGDDKNYDYDKGSFSSMGYQHQEFDEDSGELISSEDEDEPEEFLDDEYDEIEESDAFDE